MRHQATPPFAPQGLRERAGKAPFLADEDLRQRLLDALLAPTEARKMSYEEFLARADEDTLAEWVDGEVVMTSPASDPHQDIIEFLVAILRPYTQSRRLGRLRVAPFQMKLESSGREPDLLFVAQANLERLRRTYLDGPADLVVEITSPESEGRDRGEKFYEYARSGVREYWLIDPEARWAEFYRLDAERHYRIAFAGAEGIYRAEVIPGFWLQVEWLWQEPKPHPLRALGEIAGVDSAQVDAFLRALSGERQ